VKSVVAVRGDKVMPIKQEIEAAVKAVNEIPASNRGVMEFVPNDFEAAIKRGVD
jgi:hypothetical protein